MQIISISAEIAPWSKTGGLGDVCGALPIALARRGHRVMTVAPRYEAYDDAWFTGITADIDGHKIAFYHCEDQGVDRVFIDHISIRRQGIYGNEHGSFADNWFRFSLLCQGAILAAMQLPLNGSVYTKGKDSSTAFLFHDWHASLTPGYLETARRWGLFKNAASALVIHNLAHQGVHSKDIYPKLALPFDLYPALDMSGNINLLKGGIMLADKVVTVSPTYAKEICTPELGAGLDGVLRMRKQHLHGILNGIDIRAWDPKTDPHIASNYSANNLQGKAACKRALQRELGLPSNPKAPIFGFISRLDHQKGVDLIEGVLPFLLKRGAQVVLLGTGSPKLEQFLHTANRHPNVAGLVKFSNELAHKITAGADFLLMPSRFEPCGLTQQHALAYGTIPVVHATGGLKDTVQNFNPWKGVGNGWCFSPLQTNFFKQALRWALATYYDAPEDFKKLKQRSMSADRSWNVAAAQYEKLLKNALYLRQQR